MNTRNGALLTMIYTLSPTHCGTGQAAGAVDLPIARESHTGFPLLPATSLKGVARDIVAGISGASSAGKEDVKRLFGPETTEAELNAGELLFTEGRLIAYPVRSLNRPFFHVTCPLVIERLGRDLRIMGHGDFLPKGWTRSSLLDGRAAALADPIGEGEPLVLEDLVYQPDEVVQLTGARALAESIATLFPHGEEDTRERFISSLVVIPDVDFQDLISRVIPVRARIRLNDRKTTTGGGINGGGDSGNLWYEELIPSDCLFVSFIGERRQRVPPNSRGNSSSLKPTDVLWHRYGQDMTIMQIGGNETVGNGLCWWTLRKSRHGAEEAK